MFFKFVLWNDKDTQVVFEVLNFFRPSLKFKWSAHFFYQVPRIENETNFFADEPIFGFKLYAPARLKQY